MQRLTFLPLLCAAMLLPPGARAADQTRSVGPFTSVANSGPISIVIDVGGTQSVTASGNDSFLGQLVTEVVDGELRIRIKDHSLGNTLGDPMVTITVPLLTKYSMAGAGTTRISHVSGDRLDLHVAGAGSLRADGAVKTLRMNLGGVGEIDTRALHAETADVSVGGVGSVKVWASSRLDASVGGVGSLTYYGDPKVVNTSGGGLGSISRGK